MNNDTRVIWQKGDSTIPDKAKYVVESAQDELLLRALQLPSEVVDTIRYNAEKNAQTVNDYISTIVIERLQTAS